MSVLLIIALLVVMFGVYMFIRNQLVFTECMRVLNLVSQLAQEDINNDRSWKWRYDAYEEVSYDNMVLCFWIPIGNFFKNHRCLSKRKGG